MVQRLRQEPFGNCGKNRSNRGLDGAKDTDRYAFYEQLTLFSNPLWTGG
jgi:hypothetical protein